jgi:parvulin-like peptidyl-prolyl isomerase
MNGKQLARIGVALGLALALTACGRNSDVVAVVDGVEITQSQLTQYLQYKRVDQNNAAAVAAATQTLIKNTALVAALQQQDDIDLAAIELELAELRKDLLLNQYLEQFLAKAVDETAMRNYYAENQAQYQQRKAKVAHILFRVNADMTEAERQAVYSRAMEAYSKVRTDSDFAKVATELSEDKISAKNGGELGWLQEGAVSPLFSNTVFGKAKVGQPTEPILTEFGYHIVLLQQEPTLVKQAFETVSGDIKRILRKTAKDAELERLRASISVDQPAS